MPDRRQEVLPGKFAAHLAEFEALRQEIKQRSYFQHSFLVLLIMGYGSVGGFALNSADRTHLLVILPVLGGVMYMLWIHQAMAINGIARYIEEKLAKECSDWVGQQVLAWESQSSMLGPKEAFVRRGAFLLTHTLWVCVAPVVINLYVYPSVVSMGPIFRLAYVAAWLATGLSFALYLFWHRGFYGAWLRRRQ